MLEPTATGAAYWDRRRHLSAAAATATVATVDNDNGVEVCSALTGCTSLHTWVIVVASVLPSLFVLGWLESYVWFRQLVLGKTAWRFGTLCWILISLWVLCFTRLSLEKTAEEQVPLRTQWSAMSTETKWKLWWKWGFRHAYLVELLGPDPRLENQAQTEATMPRTQFQGVSVQEMPYKGIPVQRVQEQPPEKTCNEL